MTLLASRAATLADFAWVIDSIKQKKINLAPWITHRATPEQMVKEFPNWLTPDAGVIKAILTFEA
jgi:threonine dehydrogenase-like Zn-dependent dehydrogenase